MQASVEQIQAILAHLGAREARRRGIDLVGLSRDEASKLLRRWHHRKTELHISSGGRPARPLGQLPNHQQKLIQALAANPHDPRHGTQYAYSAGRCKCARCREAGTGRPQT